MEYPATKVVLAIPELPYYNVFYIHTTGTNVGAWVVRNVGDHDTEYKTGSLLTGIGGHTWGSDVGIRAMRFELTSPTTLKWIGCSWMSASGGSITTSGASSNESVNAILGVL